MRLSRIITSSGAERVRPLLGGIFTSSPSARAVGTKKQTAGRSSSISASTPEAQIEYDGGPDPIEQIRDRVRAAAAAFGQRRLARASGVAREQIRAITHNDAVPRKATVSRLLAAIRGYGG